MVEAINPIGDEAKLNKLLDDDLLFAQAAPSINLNSEVGKTEFSGNLFEDVLDKAISALNDVSQSEMYANQLIDKYTRGEVELHEVMLAQSKAGIMIQLAVTTINSAVTTFKELTQMQV